MMSAEYIVYELTFFLGLLWCCVCQRFISTLIIICMVYIVVYTVWYTVNVVIFAGGKFRENVDKTFHVGVIFTILLPFPSQKGYGFYFRVGVIFEEKANTRKTRKLPPRENFHVYSMMYYRIIYFVLLYSIWPHLFSWAVSMLCMSKTLFHFDC